MPKITVTEQGMYWRMIIPWIKILNVLDSEFQIKKTLVDAMRSFSQLDEPRAVRNAIKRKCRGQMKQLDVKNKSTFFMLLPNTPPLLNWRH